MSLAVVFQIGSLGDTIVSLPVLRSIRDFLPECSEYLLVSRFDTQLKVMPSHVFDMVWKPKYQVNYRHPGGGLLQIGSTIALLAQLRYYRPKHGIYLMPAYRSKQQVDRDRLFFRLGGVKNLHGFQPLAECETTGAGVRPSQVSEAFLRFCRIWGNKAETMFLQYATPPLIDPGEGSHKHVAEWLAAHRRYPTRPLIALCPYSNCSARSIPSAYISSLLYRLETELALEVVLLGGSKDAAEAGPVIKQSGAGLNGCGVFSVEQSASLLKMCRMVVATESGPMHLAGAVGAPCITTFSRVNKQLAQWLPLSLDSTILYREVDCAGCGLNTCPVAGHPCMSGIRVDEILTAVARKIDGLPERPLSLDGTQVIEWTSTERVNQ